MNLDSYWDRKVRKIVFFAVHTKKCVVFGREHWSFVLFSGCTLHLCGVNQRLLYSSSVPLLFFFSSLGLFYPAYGFISQTILVKLFLYCKT
jgi:hypothetical protein